MLHCRLSVVLFIMFSVLAASSAAAKSCISAIYQPAVERPLPALQASQLIDSYLTAQLVETLNAEHQAAVIHSSSNTTSVSSIYTFCSLTKTLTITSLERHFDVLKSTLLQSPRESASVSSPEAATGLTNPISRELVRMIPMLYFVQTTDYAQKYTTQLKSYRRRAQLAIESMPFEVLPYSRSKTTAMILRVALPSASSALQQLVRIHSLNHSSGSVDVQLQTQDGQLAYSSFEYQPVHEAFVGTVPVSAQMATLPTYAMLRISPPVPQLSSVSAFRESLLAYYQCKNVALESCHSRHVALVAGNVFPLEYEYEQFLNHSAKWLSQTETQLPIQLQMLEDFQRWTDCMIVLLKLKHEK